MEKEEYTLNPEALREVLEGDYEDFKKLIEKMRSHMKLKNKKNENVLMLVFTAIAEAYEELMFREIADVLFLHAK